jgi:hypothetical protein
MRFKSDKQRKAVMAKLKAKYGSRYIGASEYRTAIELGKRKYISKFFIPDIMKVPIVKKDGDFYVLLRGDKK